jgi:NADH:ubiquinone oxidoreductase subunit 4 (subunit M)
MLNILILTLLLGIIKLFLISSTDNKYLRIYAIFFSGLNLIITFFLILFFKLNVFGFQQLVEFKAFNYNVLNIKFTFGIDGLSIFFIFITALLIFLSVIFIWEEKKKLKQYLILLFSLEFILILTFSTLDLFLFYFFFESILIPLLLIIGF